MTNHPNRGRNARLLAQVTEDLRECATGKPSRILLWPHECAVIMEQLDRIPRLEMDARRAEAPEVLR
jgi:hypothetical protein